MVRETVTEVIAEVALRVDVPVDDGDDLAAGVRRVLSELDHVRHVEVDEIGDVDPGDDALRVAFAARVTFYLGPDAADEDPVTTLRDRFAAGEAVAEVMRFEPTDGPYRIERW